MKRIVIYSHDTYGLGNIRRTLTIANHLVQSREDVTVLIISGSPMLHAFRISPRIDYVKLPCLTRTQADGYQVRSLGIQFDELMRMRANLILNTVVDFRPDLMLVDKKPLGVGRELAPAFELLNLRGLRPRCALILRDILDNPAHTRHIWKSRRYYDALDTFYDRVLVLGEKRVFDLPAEYGVPADTARKVDFCGYIERPKGERARDDIRASLGIDDQPLVLVTPGGGADGAGLILCYLEGLAGRDAPPDYHSLILCGPEMPEEMCKRIDHLAGDMPQVHIQQFSDDIMGDMDAADLVVAMGGYNTICEIMTLAKPAIIVPRKAPVEEQWIRATRLSRLGLFDMIDPDELHPQRLQDAILTALQFPYAKIAPLNRFNMSGLDGISVAVADLLDTAPGSDGGTLRPCLSEQHGQRA